MAPLAVLSLVLTVTWVLTALAAARAGRRSSAAWCLLVAAGHVLAAIVPHAAPVVLLTWLAYGLAVPDGSLGGAGRRVALGVGGVALTGWAVAVVVADQPVAAPQFVAGALAVSAAVAASIALRAPKATPAQRAVMHWLGSASVLSAAAVAVLLALRVMAGTPDPLQIWLACPLLLVPLGQLAAALVGRSRVAETVLIESIVVSGLAVLTVVVYLVVVVGLGHAPEGAERGILVSSLVAAVVVAALAQPVRHRLVELGNGLVDRREASAEEVVSTFGARMSRAVPMDELMLQLTESLRATVADAGAEIWVGADGVLDRTVSVPFRPAARAVLGERERVVVGRARLGGQSWASVWLPDVVVPDEDLRVAPVAHLGDLLGLIVVRRSSGSPPVSEDDERQLVELARQLGLALHNVRLDSALQRSLEELQEANTQLRASRLRIVTAADHSRQAIERNLHDGAQQHLVALAVKLGLAESLVSADPDTVMTLLQELRGDVRTTIAELRELAHGIYPPLLRDRGLGEALRAAANRSPLGCTIDVDLPQRYPQEIETATYFCCLEAMQNAGKHAGPAATLRVSVGLSDGALVFSVADDGAGFPADASRGHGFVNMDDRLGAIGGRLTVASAPGAGTTISGRIPLPPSVVEPVEDGRLVR